MTTSGGAAGPVRLPAEGDRLLDFARAARHPSGGFGWLDEKGRIDPARPRALWITCRMTHVFALAHLLGTPWAGELADHGLAALSDLFRDEEHGGWYPALGSCGPTSTDKTAYEHVFVVLAAASATAAARPGAAQLLRDALAVLDRHFWDPGEAMLVEHWDRAFTRLDGYRGANANMHGVEAMLAAADVTGDGQLRDRALGITERIVHRVAPRFGWRLPEHFDDAWRPLPGYHRDRPADPFRPYGATVGHWLEWARLAVTLHAALGADAPDWLLDDGRSLFAAAVATWGVDGAAGFVYTVDRDGRPVVRQRMHWVVAEAICAAASLHAATGEAPYARWAERFRTYADAHLVDPEHGSWHHELGRDNRPAHTVWEGKPDVYHAFQAVLLPRLPLTPCAAVALRNGRPR